MPSIDVTNASDVSPLKRTRTETHSEDDPLVLKFAKLSELATTPTRGSPRAAGYDLYRFVYLVHEIIIPLLLDF